VGLFNNTLPVGASPFPGFLAEADPNLNKSSRANTSSPLRRSGVTCLGTALFESIVVLENYSHRYLAEAGRKLRDPQMFALE